MMWYIKVWITVWTEFTAKLKKIRHIWQSFGKISTTALLPVSSCSDFYYTIKPVIFFLSSNKQQPLFRPLEQVKGTPSTTANDVEYIMLGNGTVLAIIGIQMKPTHCLKHINKFGLGWGLCKMATCHSWSYPVKAELQQELFLVCLNCLMTFSDTPLFMYRV